MGRSCRAGMPGVLLPPMLRFARHARSSQSSQYSVLRSHAITSRHPIASDIIVTLQSGSFCQGNISKKRFVAPSLSRSVLEECHSTIPEMSQPTVNSRPSLSDRTWQFDSNSKEGTGATYWSPLAGMKRASSSEFQQQPSALSTGV